jgi:methyl-accepting chemotaxis protein
VLSTSNELTATAETLSREVDTFFRNLRGDAHDQKGGAVRSLAIAS